MSSSGQQLYDEFVKIFQEANNDLNKENQLRKAQDLWNKVKSDKESLSRTIRQLKTKTARRKSTLESFWTKAVAFPPVKKKQKNDTPSCSTYGNELPTSAIVTDEEKSVYYFPHCLDESQLS